MKTLTEIGLNATTIKSLFSIWGFVLVIFSVLCLIFYFLKACGLYKMAKHQKIKKSEYAFIPFLNCILIDDLACSCGARNSGKCTKSKKLLVSKVIFALFSLISFVKTVFSLIDITFIADNLMYNGKEVNFSEVKSIIFGAIIFFAVAVISFVVYFVFLIVDLSKVYTSFSNNKTALIICSIVFPVLIPILLFSIKNNKNFCLNNDNIYGTNAENNNYE